MVDLPNSSSSHGQQSAQRQSFTITPNTPQNNTLSNRQEGSLRQEDDGTLRISKRVDSLRLDDVEHPMAVASIRTDRPSLERQRGTESHSLRSRASKALSVSTIVSKILGGEGVHEVLFPKPPVSKKKKPNYIRTTNYTLLTFLPLNLFRQIFTRYYNAYFTVAALTTISGSAALNWWSQVIPLVLVLTVTALKDGYEDIMRWKADRLANNRQHIVIENGSKSEIAAERIAMGDILCLGRGEKVPADAILLSSETDDGTCFIETAELDGETNLKRKAGLLDLALYNTDSRVQELIGAVHCDVPNENLNVFNGKLMLHRFAGPYDENGVRAPKSPVAPSTATPTTPRSSAAQTRRHSNMLLSRRSREDINSTYSSRLSTVDRVRSTLNLGKRLSKVRIDPEATSYALSINQFIPRGAVIRNVAFCYVLVVYVGHDTKIMRNLKKSKTKASRMERELNHLVLGIFLYNIFLIVSSMILEYNQWNKWRNLASSYFNNPSNQQWYFADNGWLQTSTASHLGTSFLSFFSLYTYVIPISLFVTMEIVRFLQGRWMMWDEHMKAYRVHDLTGETEEIPMKANNTNLNEELGSVDFIFSDKTGTLTQNKMTADKWFVEGAVYDERNQPGCIMQTIETKKVPKTSTTKNPAQLAENLEKFLRALGLCNTAIPSPHEKTGKIIYESQSPDESALLVGTEQNKVKLVGRLKNTVTISVCGEEEVYELLNTLEFSSDRKRMSVLVKTPKKEIWLLCKGADNIVFERLNKSDTVNSASELTAAQKALDEFAATGLRTLAVAGRVVSDKEYAAFAARYSEAEQALENRDERVAEVCELIEKDMELFGCTAIEDELQDQVPETIAFLRQCDIKLWLLTGDKLETAINIGFSSQFIDREMRLFILSETDVERSKQLLEQWINEIGNESIRSSMSHARRNVGSVTFIPEDVPEKKKYGLVIVGHALTKIWADKNEKLLLDLGQQCHSVICCRVTPLQKANVVKLIKDNTKAITLAIGDGANDVSMIQSASIGVGIVGREGSQAQRASDYAFGEFKFLARLLAVHGRYSYLRFSRLIYYSFYKNFTLITVQWIFNFYNSWSASLVFDEIFMTLYNVIFTSIPPVILALFEKDVSAPKIGQYPRLYKEVRGKLYWHWRLFLLWITYAMISAIVIFFFIKAAIGDGDMASNGRTIGYTVQAIIFSTAILLTVMLQYALLVRYWVQFTIESVVLCIAIDIIVMFVLSVFPFSTAENAVYIVHAVGDYYLLAILVPITCCLLYFASTYIRRVLSPSDTDIIAEEEKLENRFKKLDPETAGRPQPFNIVEAGCEKPASKTPKDVVSEMDEMRSSTSSVVDNEANGVASNKGQFPTIAIIPLSKSSSQESTNSNSAFNSLIEVQRVRSMPPQLSPLQLSPFDVEPSLEMKEK